MSDLEATVRALDQRVRELEDRLAIFQLMFSYGPAADSGSARAAAGLWTEDGVYAVGDLAPMKGHAELEKMYEGDSHQGLIKRGSVHLTASPIVTITGDTAVATCYSFVYLHEGDSYRIWRMSSNRWELVRTAGGWRIARRTNQLLDGSEEARRILARGVA
jgi:ketosteroid isomerase-like protein